MARSLSTTVTEAYNDMRLDSFLYESGLYESRSKAVKQIEAGKVFVGGQSPTKKTLVHTGDFIVYEEFESNDRVFLEPQDIPLDVFYEDEDMAVINKQAGLICHPSPDILTGPCQMRSSISMGVIIWRISRVTIVRYCASFGWRHFWTYACCQKR